MKRDPCQTIEELLVDFADEALTGAEAARVRDHVGQCPQCRATVTALRQSLQCAQTIWQDNLPPVQSGSKPVLRALRWRYVAAAAGILLAVGTLTYWPSRPEPAPSGPTLAEIESRIAASGRAARLLARVDQLETQASLQPVAASQYRYIAERYPDTTAAASARLKLESLP
jgi:hypothetical protein